jgi:hypothetical protein
MRIEDALSQVRTIQTHLARTQRCCCYCSATVAASGFFAVLAAATQSVHLPNPLLDLQKYLFLWIGVAALSVAVIAAEMLWRWQQTQSRHARRQTVAALRQFAPCLTTGALLTWAIVTASPEHAALLPGLWSIVFSLGVFASATHLPPAAPAIGAYYLIAGLVCVVWGQADQALRPWTMVITFAVGQSMAAVVLYYRQEQEGEDAGD